ncbi:serine/arginine repetitive matrix protein 1-like isoform X1 [Perca fluviatilis]|uniref:serine/arginine repetitive matrix protein 1-like isoform X1 n=1 Tax=Perca fluviatilis TaxID=8168 RepID=UPI001962E2AF|nr:serine/arginine repetitive matrix protein 1-like isoform X1 [Perca fluviatilis]XP_039676624.1 serine/arginine repetitive matrix protein 1-like isoform X1 [Perca fluviatilis]
MEEEMRTAETEQGDVASNEGECSVEMANSPTKKGRGRPQGSKKLKVCVTDVNLMELVSGISNGGSTQPPRKRGRPKLTKQAEHQGAGDDHADDSVQTQGSEKHASNEDSLTTDCSPKKRGRPRKHLSYSTPEKADTKDLMNGGSETPKARSGRPKGSTKRKLESLTSEETEGGFVTRRLETELSSEGEEERGDKEQAKRGRGRPKGSLNKKPPAYKVGSPRRSLTTKEKRGRPRKQPTTRGRPRKYPLPSPEELKKPKVWKPLGRPRKYPRVDPPEGSLPAPRRSRGRPRKSESKKGAHLRKNLPASSSSPCNPNVGSPRKRGRPPSTPKKDAGSPRKRGRPKGSSPCNPNVGSPRKRGRPPSTPKKDAEIPRKRGRPKGSVNKKEAGNETQLDGHSKAKGDSSPVVVEHEAELAEDEVEHDDAEASMEPDTEASIVHDTEMTIEHDTETSIMDNTEESLID